MPEMKARGPMYLFFDIDGTLSDDRAAGRAGVAAFYDRHRERLSFTKENFWTAWDEAAGRHFDRYTAGECTFRGQRRARLRELFKAPDMPDAEADALFDEYHEIYAGRRQLYPDALPCLAALAAFPQGIISNGDGPSQREKLRGAGLEGRFTPVVISGELGFHKPDPRIFMAACRRAGRPPAECLYVGDRLDADAQGSADAGLVSVWLDRDGKGGAPAGATVIKTLAELPAVVESLA